MEKERAYDVGAAKYAARKLLKAFKKREIDDPRLVDHMSTIVAFAQDSCIPNLKKRVQRVSDYLMTRQGIFSDILDTVQKIEEHISMANEKRRVMEVREKVSGTRYRKRMAMEDYDACPSKLNKYDIVMVPTMGGMHYSIVSEVDGEYVTCFPMTTASRRDLGLIGTKSVSLSGCGDNRYEGIRLSASAAKVSVKDAVRSYVGSVADNPAICGKLARVLSLA